MARVSIGQHAGAQVEDAEIGGDEQPSPLFSQSCSLARVKISAGDRLTAPGCG